VPTYSYRCQECAVEFDVQQAFTDSSLTTCEACGGTLRKLFSAVGVTFSGSVFYRTDARASADAAKKKAAAKDSPSKKPEKTAAATTTSGSSTSSTSSSGSSSSGTSSSASSSGSPPSATSAG